MAGTNKSLCPNKIASVETIDASESERFGGPEFGHPGHKKLFKGRAPIIAFNFEAHGLVICHSFKPLFVALPYHAIISFRAMHHTFQGRS